MSTLRALILLLISLTIYSPTYGAAKCSPDALKALIKVAKKTPVWKFASHEAGNTKFLSNYILGKEDRKEIKKITKRLDRMVFVGTNKVTYVVTAQQGIGQWTHPEIRFQIQGIYQNAGHAPLVNIGEGHIYFSGQLEPQIAVTLPSQGAIREVRVLAAERFSPDGTLKDGALIYQNIFKLLNKKSKLRGLHFHQPALLTQDFLKPLNGNAVNLDLTKVKEKLPPELQALAASGWTEVSRTSLDPHPAFTVWRTKKSH